MKVELTIQEMFDYYPTLFKERADCLNHLFLVLGSGYRWKNGELVDTCSSYPKNIKKELKAHLVDGKAFQHNKLSLRGEAIYYDDLRKIEHPDYVDPLSKIYSDSELKKRHDKYLQSIPDDQYYTEPNRRYRWYCCRKNKDGSEYINWCEDYIPLLNVPEDIKPDWLAAVQETKALLAQDGLVYKENKNAN